MKKKWENELDEALAHVDQALSHVDLALRRAGRAVDKAVNEPESPVEAGVSADKETINIAAKSLRHRVRLCRDIFLTGKSTIKLTRKSK